MNNITLKGQDATYPPLDIRELMAKFAEITDHRKARGIRYSLPCLLTMILLARLAGETKSSGIADWLQLRKDQLATFFDLARPQMPSLFQYIFQAADSLMQVNRSPGVYSLSGRFPLYYIQYM